MADTAPKEMAEDTTQLDDKTVATIMTSLEPNIKFGGSCSVVDPKIREIYLSKVWELVGNALRETPTMENLMVIDNAIMGWLNSRRNKNSQDDKIDIPELPTSDETKITKIVVIGASIRNMLICTILKMYCTNLQFVILEKTNTTGGRSRKVSTNYEPQHIFNLGETLKMLSALKGGVPSFSELVDLDGCNLTTSTQTPADLAAVADKLAKRWGDDIWYGVTATDITRDGKMFVITYTKADGSTHSINADQTFCVSSFCSTFSAPSSPQYHGFTLQLPKNIVVDSPQERVIVKYGDGPNALTVVANIKEICDSYQTREFTDADGKVITRWTIPAGNHESPLQVVHVVYNITKVVVNEHNVPETQLVKIPAATPHRRALRGFITQRDFKANRSDKIHDSIIGSILMKMYGTWFTTSKAELKTCKAFVCVPYVPELQVTLKTGNSTSYQDKDPFTIITGSLYSGIADVGMFSYTIAGTIRTLMLVELGVDWKTYVDNIVKIDPKAPEAFFTNLARTEWKFKISGDYELVLGAFTKVCQYLNKYNGMDLTSERTEHDTITVKCTKNGIGLNSTIADILSVQGFSELIVEDKPL